MAIILVIVALFLIGWLIEKIKKFFNENDQKKKFKLSFSTQFKKIEDENIETIQLKLSGVLSFKKKISKTELIVRFYDITGGSSQNGIPVRSYIKELRLNDGLNLVIREIIPGEIEAGSGSLQPVVVKEIPTL